MRQSQPNAQTDREFDMEIPMPVLVLIIVGMLITGIILGTLVERLRWNGLIQEGYLPRPTGRNKSRRI